MKGEKREKTRKAKSELRQEVNRERERLFPYSNSKIASSSISDSSLVG